MADTAEKKTESTLKLVTDFLKNEDTQKGIKDLSAIWSNNGLTQAEKEKLVKEFYEKDEERLKKEKEWLNLLKKNEDKIKTNEELLNKSKAVVGQLEKDISINVLLSPKNTYCHINSLTH